MSSRALDPLLSIKEAAGWLGCHSATIRRLIMAGKLRATRLSARRIGIAKSEIERYLAENQIAVAA